MFIALCSTQQKDADSRSADLADHRRDNPAAEETRRQPRRRDGGRLQRDVATASVSQSALRNSRLRDPPVSDWRMIELAKALLKQLFK
jgi:hypothetical protein